jgi:cellulose synthase/poly-beta-1,6-N-acetylglucosamine synthase-like glycosyltransferase
MDFGDIIIYAIIYFSLYSSIIFLMNFFENKDRLKNPPVKKFFKVSIIVPAHNEEKTLTKTVNSLLNLDYPKDKLEIIVIDDGSTDGTLKLARGFIPDGVRVFTKQNTGKGSSMNFGLARATGEVVGALDADSFVLPTALKRMIGYFENPRVMAVTPSIKIWGAKNLKQRLQFIEFLSSAYIRKVFSYFGAIPITPGPFTLYRKAFFDKYGGYDTSTLTEDIEISLRIESKKKYLIENAMDVSVYTTAVPKFNKLLLQRLRWYRGFIDNLFRYRRMFGTKYGNMGVFVLPLSILVVLASLFVTFYAIYLFIKNIIFSLKTLRLSGYDFSSWFEFDFEPFFISITPKVMFTVLLLALGILLIYLATKYSEEQQKVEPSYVVFFFLYIFFFSFWWTMAILYKITGKKIAWGKQKL